MTPAQITPLWWMDGWVDDGWRWVGPCVYVSMSVDGRTHTPDSYARTHRSEDLLMSPLADGCVGLYR